MDNAGTPTQSAAEIMRQDKAEQPFRQVETTLQLIADSQVEEANRFLEGCFAHLGVAGQYQAVERFGDVLKSFINERKPEHCELLQRTAAEIGRHPEPNDNPLARNFFIRQLVRLVVDHTAEGCPNGCTDMQFDAHTAFVRSAEMV